MLFRSQFARLCRQGLLGGIHHLIHQFEGAPLGYDFSASVDLPGKSALVDQLGPNESAAIVTVPHGGVTMDPTTCTISASW